MTEKKSNGVTLTIREALMIRKILSELGETRMPVDAITRIIKLIDELDVVYGDYMVGMEGIYEELALKDEYGVYIKDDNGNPMVPTNRQAELRGRKKALESRETMVYHMIEHEAVKNLELTISEYKLLRKILT